MKKIGFVLPCFPVLSETFVGVQIREMEALGHPISLYAFEQQIDHQPLDESLKQRCQYLSCNDSYSLYTALYSLPRCHTFLKQQSGFRYFGLHKQGMQLADRVAKDGCEHLHAHFAWHSTATAIIAAKALNIPVSFVTHGDDLYVSPQDISAKLQHATFVCAVTRKMQCELQSQTATPIHYLPCGLETQCYAPALPNWASKPKRALFIGRLVKKKGIETLLHALARLPTPMPLDIVGHGNLKDELIQQTQALGLPQVRFLGGKTAQWLQENAPDYQALIAPFEIADNGSQDTGPLVIKEAMMLGLPVITTDLPGCIEILPPQMGTIVPMKNANALAQAITHHQLRSLNDLNRQRQKAFQHVRHHFCGIQLAKTFSRLIEQDDHTRH